MRVFRKQSFLEETKSFIQQWVVLLSNGKFDEACAQLNEIQNATEIIWTGEKLKNVCLEYYWHESVPIINNPLLMDCSGETIDFYEYNDGTGYAVEYDIPMNGEWSDLTAQFSFKRNTNELYSIFLHDIHVL